jgi:hypothetical protein
MKQRLYWFSVLAAFLAALSLSGPAMAAGQQVPFKGRSSGGVTLSRPAATAGKSVPFKGRSSGAVTVTDFAYPFVTTSVVGEGEATHLGRFTLTAEAVIDVSLPGGPAAGSWILTAANGDQLFMTFVAYGIDPTHGHGDFTIVGGTGRFQGATGSYTQLITFATPPGSSPSTAYTDVLKGMISFGHE